MCPVSVYSVQALATANMAAVSGPEIGVGSKCLASKNETSLPASETANVDEDEGFEPNFDLSDADMELRLSALANMVKNLSLRREAKQSFPFKKLIIKPKQQLIDEKENLQDATEMSKPRSPSSLKSPNSPTSGQKKSVRFADSIGLDLAHVKLFQSDKIDRYAINDDFFESDSIPLLSPTRRVNSSDVTSSLASASYSAINFNERYLAKRFTLRNIRDVFETTDEQKVCLESLDTTRMFVSGQIQVQNIAFEKKVSVRYTLDGWHTYAEMPCSFSYSNVDNRDVFCFSLCLPRDLPVGSCCEMCVRYSVAGQNFWDNNDGENYKFDCCSANLPKKPHPNAVDDWTIAQLNLPTFM